MKVFCFHEDFATARGFRRRSKLDEFFDPESYETWYLQCPSRSRNWKLRHIPEMLERFDWESDGKPCILIGASDGATMALQIALERSEQCRLLISYAGRIWYYPESVENNFSIISIFNGRDRRYYSRQYADFIQLVKGKGHRTTTQMLPNRWGHFGQPWQWNWGTWDASQNERIWSYRHELRNG